VHLSLSSLLEFLLGGLFCYLEDKTAWMLGSGAEGIWLLIQCVLLSPKPSHCDFCDWDLGCATCSMFLTS